MGATTTTSAATTSTAFPFRFTGSIVAKDLFTATHTDDAVPFETVSKYMHGEGDQVRVNRDIF